MKLLVIIATIVALVKALPIDEKLAKSDSNYRLDEGIAKPIEYNLEITPYFFGDPLHDQFTFSGKVEIRLEILADTNLLRLNSKYLDIKQENVEIINESDLTDIVVVDDITLDEATEILTINFNEDLITSNSYKLIIVYTGEMKDDNRGFFRSSYKEDGATVWLGSTQFQVTHARRAFPCFDEPQYKASIQLRINDIPLDYGAISNTKGDDVDMRSDKKSVQFKKTPVMSTYLLAFVVSKFEAYSETGILSVYGRPSHKLSLQTAYEFGVNILEELENYFLIKYTDMVDGDNEKLEKLDMVAIPDMGGAMENWGLLTYQEVYLMYDMKHTTLSRKQGTAGIIAHEQTHLWFGDLVTCKWWDNAWLNEGFAQYFQYHIVHLIEPDWEMDKQFVVEQLQSALLFDSTDSTHPMSHQAETPAEASGMFSSISYNKAASIIRMIKYIIGETDFQKGLQEYLGEFRYGNTVPNDLLSKFEHPDINEIAKTWIEQSNYPLVTVTYDKEGKKAKVEQTAFMLKKTQQQNTKLWSIPLTYTFGPSPDFDTTEPIEYLHDQSIDINIDTKGSWLIFNIQQTGFYRVNYDEAGWNLIKDALLKDNHDGIHELNRAQIVDDLFNLARAEEISYDLAFSVLEYLKTEEHYLPWFAAFNGFSHIINKLDPIQLDMFKVYMFKLLNKSNKSFKWEESTGENLSDLQTANVFTWLCKLGHIQCQFESSKILDAGLSITAISNIPVQLRAPTICSIVKNPKITLTDFDLLWKYADENIWQQQAIITAIGCTTNEEILTAFFDKVLDREITRHHFRRAAFDSTYTQSLENVQFVLDYLIENHTKISNGFNDLSAVITTISTLSARFTKLEQVVQVENFYEENVDLYKDHEARILDIIAKAKEDLDWVAKHFSTLPIEVRTAYYRLEETILPVHYDIEITPYIETEAGKEQFTFDGIVHIDILPTEDGRNTLRLNMKNLVIDTVTLTNKKDSLNIETSYTISDEFITLYFANNLINNQEYRLKFEYKGTMDLDMHGFYRSSYVQNGVTEHLGSTQLQSTHARRVFPGFDEPEYKATFSLTIIKLKTYTAYSNMNPVSDPTETPNSNYDKVTFKTTPKMSTYLLAFTVAKFQRRVNQEGNFGVIARPDQYDQTLYAYTDGIATLDKLEKELDYPYYQGVVDKLDMVALPDFSAGAMENWGLITYRESNLLYDVDYTTQFTKQRILTVIAHEQAHLWFGDLVTCKWWEYTWLNEGFATYFQYFGAHLVQPTWEIDKQFVVEQVHTALLFDSNESSHPMSSPVYSPADASAIFDTISYNKAGSIIRMIRHLIGDTKFKNALKSYLETNKFASSTPDKLFKEFTTVANDEYPDLENIIRPWTTQANYPVVKVTYNSEKKEATVTQKPFLLNKSANSGNTWSIPLTYTSRENGFSNLKPEYILSSSTGTIGIDVADSWLIFNVQQTGFYRVDYSEDGWLLIKQGLQSENHDGIHEINRAQIVDDLLNFARADEVSYEFAFSMLHYLKNETHYLPWNAAFTNFALLTSKMNQTQLDTFRTYLVRLLRKSYKEVDWSETEEDSVLKIYHRANVINWLCRSKYENCITKAKQYFDEYKADETKLVPINIRGPVFCSVMRNGTQDELNFLWEKYLEQEVATEKNIISQAIGCASDKTLLFAVIDKLLTDDIRSQDKRTMLTNTFTQTEENVQHVLDYVIEHFGKIKTGFEGDASAVITTITGLANRFTNEEQINQVTKFLEDNKAEFGSYSVRITNALTDARANLEWSKDNIKAIIDQIEINIEEDGEEDGEEEPEDEDDGAGTITVSFLMITFMAMCTLLYN